MAERAELNEHHRRRLLVSCQYVDSLLADIEWVLAAEVSGSPFPKYVHDIGRDEEQDIRSRIRALRTQLTGLLREHKVAIPEPSISQRHSILTSLNYIDVAVEELKPAYLGGYGAVPESLVAEMTQSVEKVQESVKAAIAAMKET